VYYSGLLGTAECINTIELWNHSTLVDVFAFTGQNFIHSFESEIVSQKKPGNPSVSHKGQERLAKSTNIYLNINKPP